VGSGGGGLFRRSSGGQNQGSGQGSGAEHSSAIAGGADSEQGSAETSSSLQPSSFALTIAHSTDTDHVGLGGKSVEITFGDGSSSGTSASGGTGGSVGSLSNAANAAIWVDTIANLIRDNRK
jgi:hypothetical protein